jgi:hypothetical protein
MGIHIKTQKIIDAARAVLEDDNPMTLRQVYYRLVATHVVENSKNSYQAVGRAIVQARKSGEIAWEWIEDRLRRPRNNRGFDDAEQYLRQKLDFGGYHRDPWEDRTDSKVELWVEKDALSGVFEPYASHYYLTLNIGRGYDGWSSIHNAATRYDDWDEVTILYFGDFDPSGEDMVRSLEDRLTELGAIHVEVKKCALNLEDVTLYNLPPDFAKKTDSRARGFIEKFGDLAVELDALPPAVLRARIQEEIENHVDMELFQQQKTIESEEKTRLSKIESRLKKQIPRLLNGR